MEAPQSNTKDLLTQISKVEQQLLKRYQNIIDLAQVPTRGPNSEMGGEQQAVADRNRAAYNSLRMEMEGAALIRTSEDILSVSRKMKELWLFGQLNTLREGKGDARRNDTEDDAKVTMEVVERLVERGVERGISRIR